FAFARRLPGELDDRLLKIIGSVVALLIGYFGLALAVRVLNLAEGAETIAIRVLLSLLVLQLMRKAMRIGGIVLDGLSQVRERFQIIEARTMPLFNLIITVLAIGVASYALLQIWHIDATAWLASAGVIGIAVGFAARDTLANLFAGFFIIADSPYKIGDYIVLDTGDRGEVTHVGVRSTRILTRDDVEVTVPNAEMANVKIYNESGGRWEKFRIRIKVGVAYGSDAHQVVELLEDLARDHPSVCNSPTPRVRMRGFGDSSLDFELLCWVDLPASRGLVSHELYMKIYDALNEANIEIPYPQNDVWFRNALPNSTGAVED
ncbi:MAG: mechanosensitive ion channel family protein, partial [Pseudomonadota bacterium]